MDRIAVIARSEIEARIWVANLGVGVSKWFYVYGAQSLQGKYEVLAIISNDWRQGFYPDLAMEIEMALARFNVKIIQPGEIPERYKHEL